MMTEYYILVAILGLVFGSFLNVCIYRIPRSESIANPPSHCTSCGARLRAVELVPVFSYIFLGGKCRYCSAKISPRYLFVELLTAFVYILLFYKYGLTPEFAAYAFFMSILIAVFFIDFDHRIIPDGLVLTSIAGGVLLMLYNVFVPVEIFGDRHWWNPLVGAITGSGFLLLVAIVGIIVYRTDEAMGMGDVKLFVPIGLFLGWRMTIVALLISVFTSGIVSLILMIFKIKDRKSTIPFGPFIVTGVFIVLIYGWEILNWYLAR